MKKSLLFALILFPALSIFAQTSGGPDAFGYVWRDNNDPNGPALNWIDITGLPGAQLVTGLTDDNASIFYDIGFDFPYYWYTVDQFKVGSNGYIIFSNGQIASPYPAIPSAALPQDFIAPMMCDLNFAEAGNPAQCWFWTNNTDTLIVSYINVPYWISTFPRYTGSNTFQLILSAVDSSITFQYDTLTGTSNATANFMSIGIENVSGTIGLQHSFDIYPFSQTAVKFYYPDSSSLAISDAEAVFSNAPESGGLFLSNNGGPFTMQSQVGNVGNQSLPSFDVAMQVINVVNVVQAAETLSTSPLNPGETEDLVSSNTFSPTQTGTYTFRTTTMLPTDATPTNNAKDLELIVVDTTQSFQTLTYAGNVPAPIGADINWTGGDAGVGVEIRPPYYPCYIHALEFFIVTNATPVGFHALVYDNTGFNNGPGNLLDSIGVAPANVLYPDAWNTLQLSTPIQIDSGSVFIAWMMDGEGISLGTYDVQPISNRTYEILGAWAIFRYREDRDLLIQAVISNSATTDIQRPDRDLFVGQFFPSPSAGQFNLNVSLDGKHDNAVFTFYDINGRPVKTMERDLTPTIQQHFDFDLSGFANGMYLCKISVGDQSWSRRVIIEK